MNDNPLSGMICGLDNNLSRSQSYILPCTGSKRLFPPIVGLGKEKPLISASSGNTFGSGILPGLFYNYQFAESLGVWFDDKIP